MEFLKFKLSGKTAFFKKPEVNSYYYFTFGNVHKVALLGIFGAVLGYAGYEKQKREETVYPEFYERLKEIRVGIMPAEERTKGCFPKKVQSFNNSVGYASREQGGNLIVKQQWLENPAWYVYVLVEGEESRKLAEAILQKQCVYMPYLGSNDHPADLEQAEILAGEERVPGTEERIDSFAPARFLQLGEEDDDILPYKYTEYLPVALTEETNLYQYEKFFYTNLPVENISCPVYRVDGKNICIF